MVKTREEALSTIANELVAFFPAHQCLAIAERIVNKFEAEVEPAPEPESAKEPEKTETPESEKTE